MIVTATVIPDRVTDRLRMVNGMSVWCWLSFDVCQKHNFPEKNIAGYPLFSADLHDPEGCSSGKLSCEEELPELGGFPSFGDLPS